LDKSDELRLLPLSISWYHADVVKTIHPFLNESAPADALCANLSSLQLRKYATPTDTASGIAVFVLHSVENAVDAKAALAIVTKAVQQIHEVLSQFLSDEACMLAFVTQFVSGAAGLFVHLVHFPAYYIHRTHFVFQDCPKCCSLLQQFCNFCIKKMLFQSKFP
jgi:hypothetical protein